NSSRIYRLEERDGKIRITISFCRQAGPGRSPGTQRIIITAMAKTIRPRRAYTAPTVEFDSFHSCGVRCRCCGREDVAVERVPSEFGSGNHGSCLQPCLRRWLSRQCWTACDPGV